MKDNILKIIIIVLLIVVVIIGVLILLKSVDKNNINSGDTIQLDGKPIGEFDGEFKESINMGGDSGESFPLQ